ncbi:MAG TPA: ABC transporter substrate-binding protein [Clostridiaceae bacterium]|nr:ABC transporter substrate-binding protein [Clostridiaceae bacterium]
MKKIISILLIAVLTITLFAGCSGSGAKDNEDTKGTESQKEEQVKGEKDEKTEDVIKIGINYELSGPAATYGQGSVEGIKLAVDKINSEGGINGKKIVLVEYDNKSEPAEATALSTRLMTKDNVLAVIGPATTGCFKATIPEAIKHKVSVISGSATADDVTADASGVKEYAFRICFSDSYQGTAMANFALNNLSAKKAVIIMDSASDYAKGLAENFTKTFEAGGGSVVTREAYVAGDKDFNSIITKIKGQQFDVIFVPGYYEEAGLIIKQARAQGINVPILGADGFDSPVLLDLAGAEALNDIYFSNHYSSLDESNVVKDFIEEFKAKYNKEPDAFNALGYDAAMFVADGIRRAAALNGESIKDALEKTTNFEGVTGTISIDENHNAVKKLVVIKLANGKQDSVIRAGE